MFPATEFVVSVLQITLIGTVAWLLNAISNATVILSGFGDRVYGLYSDDAISLFRSPIGLQTKTDQRGRFEFKGVPQGCVASVSLFHDDWAMKPCFIRTSDDIKTGRRDPDRPQHFLNWEIRESGSAIVAAKGYLIKGVVRTSDGAPVENCTVSSAWKVGSSTNASGEFVYRILPDEFVPIGKPRDMLLRFTPGDISRGLLSTTITLTESDPVPIRCVDRDGKPVAGAKLTLIHRLPPVGKVSPKQVNAAPKGISDARGQYTFRPPIVYASNLVARASLDTDTQHLWAKSPCLPIRSARTASW